MVTMTKWPSIEQYRNVIRNVQHKAQYKGQDADGNAIMDRFANLPTLKFEGTVKLHGTNASYAQSVNGGELWCQSRENIITPEKDNAGFAMFVHSVKDDAYSLLSAAIDVYGERAYEFDSILIYGEWCGQGIQKGVAISELPKMFVIFGIALADKESHKTYFRKEQVQEVMKRPAVIDNRIKCIYDYPTYSIEIDFENPHEAQNKLNELTLSVEEECPVGKAHGVSGTGEGIVWKCIEPGYEDSGFWFKVKGDKHSNSKVKTLAAVDVEKINSLSALADKVAHYGRLEQMYQQVFDTLNGGEPDIKRMGDFIKAVMADVAKEEMDTIAESGFTMREVAGPISKLVKNYLLKQLEV